MYECSAFMHVCALHACLVRVELELPTVMSFHVGTET